MEVKASVKHLRLSPTKTRLVIANIRGKKTAEAVDICVGKIVDKVNEIDGKVLITADHGNADVLLDDDGNTVTAHSLSKVPLILIAKENHTLKSGILADIAPTILDLMNLEIPKEMTGKSLLIK